MAKEVALKLDDKIVIFKDGLLDRFYPICDETRCCYLVNVPHSGGVSTRKISKSKVY